MARSRRAARISTSCLLAACLLLFGGHALAEEDRGTDDDDDDADGTRIGFDLDFAGTIDEVGVDSGSGGMLRLGHEFDLFLISLTPEATGSFYSFGGDGDARFYAGQLGARLTLGKIVEPGIFAHAGVGHLSAAESETGVATDIGLTLDFTLLPLIDIGVHAAYDALLREEGSFDWYRAGAHVVLAL
jgi:hypothetical protein